ncbi:glutamate ABC transporter substrate-binding protein [Gordonia zhaorongruii]|uniref:glutamate ABC transporter substrate-binding protein n=1 Tax=Gordonia zhaorongruii TaxID=2597659 RepID=UPI001043DCE2|nr:glutamate ABC transporter substrate-binding protein [Gordonia zhaorongruii]
MIHGRRVVVAGALALVALLSACDVQARDHAEPPTATAQVPLPPDVSFNQSIDAPDESADCDTSSLRPPAEMPDPGRMPPRTTMADIVQRGRLIVGTDLGSNPLSFRDPLSGDVKGFDVDVAHWVSQALFNDPNRIDYRMVSTGNRIHALNSGEVDMVIKSMSITCQRLNEVAFSAPYFTATQRILAYRNSGIEDVADLAKRSVCAARESTSAARVSRLVPNIRFVTTLSWADCLVMMQQGQVDAITTDTPILAGIAAQDPWVHVVGENLGYENYGIGMPKGKDDLVRFVNGVLAERRADGSWHRSYQTWLSDLGPASPPSYNYRD